MKVQLKRPSKEREGGGTTIELLPENKYLATIDSIEESGDKWNSLKVNMTLDGDVPPPADRRFLVFPASEALRSLVDLAGGNAEAQEEEFDPETVVGTKVNVYIGQRTNKQGRTFNTIKRFAPSPRKK